MLDHLGGEDYVEGLAQVGEVKIVNAALAELAVGVGLLGLGDARGRFFDAGDGKALGG